VLEAIKETDAEAEAIRRGTETRNARPAHFRLAAWPLPACVSGRDAVTANAAIGLRGCERDEFRRKRKVIKRRNINRLCGLETWIRTTVNGVRVRRQGFGTKSSLPV
jgi:hypothetical protein